jgi:NTP pyrophosphatase (non-canonical NTP hydrolase)
MSDPRREAIAGLLRVADGSVSASDAATDIAFAREAIDCHPVPALAIGSATWPGLAKLAEECGEVIQVIGKIIAFPNGEHPDGTDIVARLHDELADIAAAGAFVIEANDLDRCAIEQRSRLKLDRFRGWHEAERAR